MCGKSFESLLSDLCVMQRNELVHLLRRLPTVFPLDFTDEFLRDVPLDRLRHILGAILLRLGRDTDGPASPFARPGDRCQGTPADQSGSKR